MIWPRSQMFARIYRLYLQGLASFGPAQHISKVAPKANAERSENGFNRLSASEIDAKATALGDTYRGIGVSVGILGIAIVFFAVAPVGLNIENEMWLRVVGVVKVVMMGALFALVWRGSKTRLKVKWISARREAERLRYAALRELKDQIHQELKADAVAKNSRNLRAALAVIAEGQISYNKSKSAKYHAIEKVSEYISWLGFAIAFLCAVWLLCSEFHWIPHQSWLIFGTAFIPALVGGIHGINGFLNIGGLADEHFKMTSVLDGMRNELELMPSDDIHGIHDLAERAYGQLVDRDTQWEEGAKKVNLKPA